MKNKKLGKPIKKSKGIRRLFFIPTSIVLAIVFVSTSVFFTKQYHKDFEESTLYRMEFLKNSNEAWIENISDVLSLMSSSTTLTDNKEELLKLYSSIEEDNDMIKMAYFGGTLAYKDGGDFIVNDNTVPVDFDQTLRPWYINAVSNKGSITQTKPFRSLSQKDGAKSSVIFAFSKAIYKNDSIYGVCSFDVSIESFVESMNEYSKKVPGNIYLVYSDGQYLTHEDTDFIMNEQENIFKILPREIATEMENKLITFNYRDGNYYSSTKIESTGWYIIEYGKNSFVIGKMIKLYIILIFFISFIFFAQFILVNTIVIPLSNILSESASNMKLMSEGNFVVSFSEKYKKRLDEAGVLIRSSDEMKNSLISILNRINSRSKEINIFMNKMSEEIDNLSSRTETQASSLEEVSGSIEEMSYSIKETADGAKTATTVSVKVKDTAQSGVAIVNETINSMQQISDASKKISDITSVIKNIALQTNILALNAAVEAARAGEQGRGFGVVASEVRALAVTTSNSVKDISNLINDTVSKIAIGKEAAERSGVILSETEKLVNDVANFLSDISNAVVKEENSIEHIKMAIEALNKINHENVILANSSSDISKEVVNKARELSDEVEFFKF